MVVAMPNQSNGFIWLVVDRGTTSCFDSQIDSVELASYPAQIGHFAAPKVYLACFGYPQGQGRPLWASRSLSHSDELSWLFWPRSSTFFHKVMWGLWHKAGGVLEQSESPRLASTGCDPNQVNPSKHLPE